MKTGHQPAVGRASPACEKRLRCDQLAHKSLLSIRSAKSCEIARAWAPPKGSKLGRLSPSRSSPRSSGVVAAGATTLSPSAHTSATSQTLQRSFVVGGIGLHTGEYAVVRIMPAFAGDGRYFVRVPDGCNQSSWQVDRPEDRQSPGSSAPGDRDAQPASVYNAQRYFDYVQRQEHGDFSGTFGDFLQLQQPALAGKEQGLAVPVEQLAVGGLDEDRLQAEVKNVQEGYRQCCVLARGDHRVWGAEHLLAALEACGIHDARIEIEGGHELPIVDGSALGWAEEIQNAGVQPSPGKSTEESDMGIETPTLEQVVTVQDGESFITFYPGPVKRLSVGLNWSATAPVVGCQWFTWSLDSRHGRDDFSMVAPARTCYPSVEVVEALLQEGLLQGGPDFVSLIGNDHEWLDPSIVRFPSDEAARHAVVDLLGDLSLLARPGRTGLPSGHYVAFNPDHSLQAKFVKQLSSHVCKDA